MAFIFSAITVFAIPHAAFLLLFFALASGFALFIRHKQETENEFEGILI
jgi:hypothetical protein